MREHLVPTIVILGLFAIACGICIVGALAIFRLFSAWLPEEDAVMATLLVMLVFVSGVSTFLVSPFGRSKINQVFGHLMYLGKH
ncbi:MAG: hypothetical protein A3B24_00385 [Candidatus Wildermuthbacteria bacterium RIFCSPLOWO2_01_FULL_48_16]|uniref:Uncharacterized protein n=1 Tax=Candidatus Wildermuthbacteria bacterium RIFCSPLOWO2_01_FULL_48_16 TaxID=1802461 RepID=A0A1G2RL98_9BACT|nr:MAG: hypothetical protein A3B24_00385 [Candidatus Wildermuthbacteria bacterium RIFCSPLOWO2_01_FULL_48_16]